MILLRKNNATKKIAVYVIRITSIVSFLYIIKIYSLLFPKKIKFLSL